MTPLEHYNLKLKEQGFEKDPAQACAVKFLDELYHQLNKRPLPSSGLWSELKKQLGIQPSAIKGLYLWGGVGRGKTWLMDIFFTSLPSDSKMRLHFHHFMQAVHDELTLLEGHKNPLKLVARNFAKQASVICLDEFHVSDITDAMLLYGLLDALFKEGITLISTSNLKPDDLYKHGLQRDRFLPAIELIKQHTHDINVDGDTDHRLRLLEKAETWYITVDDSTEQVIKARFEQMAPCDVVKNEILHINYRDIRTLYRADDVVWFDFNILCSSPRSSADYIEIARQFHTIFISHIPAMDESIDDKARRFINLIDEFYDRNIKLIVSADTLPNELYSGKQLEFEFQRTTSRLIEMRSHEYLARPHKA
jgi:cell division protein ZapE